MPYGPRTSEDQLRSIARQRITDGLLPVLFSRMMSASYGTGAVCRLCERPIEPPHVEYEVTDERDGHSLSFHLVCHAAWQLECVAQVASP